MLGEEIVGVQGYASLLPIRMDFNCEQVIEQESEPQINQRCGNPHTGTPNRQKGETKGYTYERRTKADIFA